MKIINLALSLIFILQSGCQQGIQAFAQQPPVQPPSDSQQGIWWEETDFSGGLRSHVSPYLIVKRTWNPAIVQQQSFTDALNVRFNTVYGEVSKRSKRLLLSNCHAAPVKSMYRFYKSDQTQYILQTSSTFLDYVNNATGACTELLGGLTDGKRWNWVTYKDVAIGTNGTDRAIKWDGFLTTTANTAGARTANFLVTQLGAPFAKLATGTDLTAARWYQYKVAFYDGSVYKYSNARSNAILTGSSVQDISLSDIPLGPAGTTSRIIYRTAAQTSSANVIADTTFYKVAAIADNATRTYSDTMSDSTLTSGGGATPTWATVSAGIESTPPYSRLSAIHQERLFFANDPSGVTSGKSTVYWSDVFNPDYFTTATDYELIRPDDGDEITTLVNFINILTIGKQNSWQKLYTDAATPAQWTLSDPFDPFGNIATYSAVNGTGGIFYLARDGIRQFNGQNSAIVSDVITDKIYDINLVNLGEVVGAFQNNQYFLAYTSTAGGSGFNDNVLVLDLTRNAYAQDTENISSFAVFGAGSDTGVLYSGSSLTDGDVWAHSPSFYSLIDRYKSDLDAGTFTNTQSNGTEDVPSLSLGSEDDWTQNDSAWNSENTSTWLVNASPGTWLSPIVEIDASKLEKLYWNELLGSYGAVTFAIRTASTSGGISGASWSSEFSSPSGSDVSGVTASNFIQLRATLSTSNFTETPYVFLDDNFLIKLDYDKAGTTSETSILSFLQTGYTDLDVPLKPKRIREIQLHYTGTAGTMNVGVVDDNNVVITSFPIDLSVDPTANSTDQYYGTKTDKIYEYMPPIADQIVGRKFKFTFTETGNTDWQIKKLSVQFDANPYTPYH